MKKLILIIFSVLLSTHLAFSQDKQPTKYTNPFEQAGIKGIKILTLSNGKYQEFHDLDSVVQIGTTLINVNTRKIVGFVKKDSTNSMPDASVSSRFISVDPLAEKHYNHSPYVFCANNPVIYIDPDGRDYGIYYNHETQTITIKAHYIVNSQNEKAFKQNGQEYWNNQSGKFTYLVGEGKEAKGYAINFDVTYEVNDNIIDITDEQGNVIEKRPQGNQLANDDNTNEVNAFNTLPNSHRLWNSGNNQAGSAADDKIYVKEGKKYSSDTSHEVGHTLGLSHDNAGLMGVYGGSGIGTDHISEILGGVGLGKTDNSQRNATTATGDGRVNGTIGTAPQNFNGGRVVTTQRFQRIQRRNND